jgi:hypothetical protein
MIAMQTQGVASESLAQQISQEYFEYVEHPLSWAQILGLDAPAMRPVIDVRVIFLESLVVPLFHLQVE